ncbi:hypothetical protein M0813_09370 [Anaeramoeba flamelloides]|uniref:Uncharacterized protein n=1 Tax=Anaeramoeba flamelloides TaxID=1746091 RepID=A0ABQ8X6L1_9EUKA|nr:hypothetical protein M0813_09370 [Anaeramoeba flamelloides]
MANIKTLFLEKENPEFEELLDSTDFLYKCRLENRQILEYFKRSINIKKVIKLIFDPKEYASDLEQFMNLRMIDLHKTICTDNNLAKLLFSPRIFNLNSNSKTLYESFIRTQFQIFWQDKIFDSYPDVSLLQNSYYDLIGKLLHKNIKNLRSYCQNSALFSDHENLNEYQTLIINKLVKHFPNFVPIGRSPKTRKNKNKSKNTGQSIMNSSEKFLLEQYKLIPQNLSSHELEHVMSIFDEEN